MVVLGLLLGLVGTDVNSGARRATRSTCRSSPTASASSSSPWACSASARSSATSSTRSARSVDDHEDQGADADARRTSSAWWRRSCAAPRSARCSGILPGSGSILGSFAAYSIEKKIAKDPSRFRQGRHRRRRRARVGQQRRRADLVHPDADARHSVQPGDGADDRRDDHPGHPAGPVGDDGTAGAVLGHHRLDVDRQPLPDRAQPAADRHLGAPDHGALPLSCFRRSWCSAASACSASTTATSMST